MSSNQHKRLTIDLSSQEHAFLKMLCASLGLTMREFVLRSVEEAIERYEDDIDAKAAHEVGEKIKRGEEEVIPFDEALKQLGIADLQD